MYICIAKVIGPQKRIEETRAYAQPHAHFDEKKKIHWNHVLMHLSPVYNHSRPWFYLLVRRQLQEEPLSSHPSLHISHPTNYYPYQICLQWKCVSQNRVLTIFQQLLQYMHRGSPKILILLLTHQQQDDNNDNSEETSSHPLVPCKVQDFLPSPPDRSL